MVFTNNISDTLFSDISEFQVPVTNAYTDAGYRVLSIRSNDGTYQDHNFAQNYAWCVSAVNSGMMNLFIVYCYWRPDWAGTANTLQSMVGQAGGPHPKMVVMLDVESGGNPAGDQSDGINRAYWQFANWLGNPLRVIGYANKSDFNSLWQTRPAGLRMIGAGYGINPNLPGQIAHQYTDGAVGAGSLPSGAPPFGNCDMNSADGLSVQNFAAAVGIGAAAPLPPPPPTSTPVVAVSWDLIVGQFMGART